MHHYVAHIEVEAERIDLEGVDRVMDELEDFHPSLSESPRGLQAATIALPAESLRQATAAAIRLVEAAYGGQAVAAEVMTEAEFDARQGWVPMPELVSVAEAAELLGVSRQAVMDRITRKTLPATRVGTGAGGRASSYVIPRSAIAATETG